MDTGYPRPNTSSDRCGSKGMTALGGLELVGMRDGGESGPQKPLLAVYLLVSCHFWGSGVQQCTCATRWAWPRPTHLCMRQVSCPFVPLTPWPSMSLCPSASWLAPLWSPELPFATWPFSGIPKFFPLEPDVSSSFWVPPTLPGVQSCWAATQRRTMRHFRCLSQCPSSAYPWGPLSSAGLLRPSTRCLFSPPLC